MAFYWRLQSYLIRSPVTVAMQTWAYLRTPFHISDPCLPYTARSLASLIGQLDARPRVVPPSNDSPRELDHVQSVAKRPCILPTTSTTSPDLHRPRPHTIRPWDCSGHQRPILWVATRPAPQGCHRQDEESLGCFRRSQVVLH